MGKKQQITIASPSDELRDRFDDFREEHGYNQSRAGEKALDEGLRAFGYAPEITDRATLLLHYIRAAGATLGLSGLVLIGLGLFSTLDYRFLGFNLVLIGLVLEFLQRGLAALEPALSDRLGIGGTLREGVDE